jgi:hypothetical protein
MPQPHRGTMDANSALQKTHLSDKAFIYDPNPGLPFALRMKLLKRDSNLSPSVFDSTSAFVAFGNEISSLLPPPLPPSSCAIEMPLTPVEAADDCRVLSDEIAASLPSPVAVMFPFPSDPVLVVNENNDDVEDDQESKDKTEDSCDDEKMVRYVDTLATLMVADILAQQHNELACTLEPSPLHLLVRMPPAGK